MHVTTIGLATLAALALGITGCSGASGDEALGTDEGAISSGLTANTDTTIKTSTADSSTLPNDRKCTIAKGTRVKLENPTMIGRHIRARIGEAIPACQGKAAFASGQTVYVFSDHFDGANPTPNKDAANLPSCSPARAAGAVGKFTRAMLDAIAFAEGTKGRGQDGYNIIFTYRVASSCDRHPRQLACSGSLCSDAAGRYQFLSTTWNGLGFRTFNPENQERGAASLISRRGVSLPSSRPLSSTEFSNAMSSLSYEWASLPPGRYGQPSYSMSRMRSEYCKNAGC